MTITIKITQAEDGTITITLNEGDVYTRVSPNEWVYYNGEHLHPALVAAAEHQINHTNQEAS
jgi:hypothetical protein